MEMFPVPPPMVYILQLICFTRVCTNVGDFNNRNLLFSPLTMFEWYTVFTLSVRVCLHPSVTFDSLNFLKIHCWNFIKPCKHIHIYRTNTCKKELFPFVILNGFIFGLCLCYDSAYTSRTTGTTAFDGSI